MGDSREVRLWWLRPPGCLGHHLVPLLLQLVFLVLFTGVLMVFLLQVPKVPCTKDHELIHNELMQLKHKLDPLCRPCPWDWLIFQSNCYFFSNSKRSWNDSIAAFEEMGAQMVIIHTDEEQTFLRQVSQARGHAWIGLSDLKQEGSWQWVDGSPLSQRLSKNWNSWETKNGQDEDCAELKGDGWNDDVCNNKKSWICQREAKAVCSTS